MRKILVAGNWKMHGSQAMVQSLLDGLLSAPPRPQVELAVFPPFPYLAMAQTLLRGSDIAWGAQSLNPAPKGAHTGEVSAAMLLDFGCRYVLVGHSERRTLYGERDGDVALRFAAALEAGLEPILCVGETLEERDEGRTEAVVERQLDAVLAHSGVDGFRRALVAYEPVWAIGTGKAANAEGANAVVADIIRPALAELFGDDLAQEIRVLYGGSVKGSNAAEYFNMPEIDGALVGGASLKAADFTQIVQAAAG